MSELNDHHASTPLAVRFFTHLFDMPHWHKALLMLAALLGIAGIGGKLGESATSNQASPTQIAPPTRGGESRSVLPQSRQNASPAPSAGDQQPSSLQNFLSQHGPWMRHVGLTFLAAFIIGWLFRTFVRITATLTAVAAVIFFGLSYFGVTNVDLTAVHEKYDDSMAWVNAQAVKAKDALMAHVPASFSSVGGFAIGFKRNRR